MIIMDLDPGETVSWRQVVEAAIEVRDRLAQLGLGTFVKTSGGKGLHVVSPLRPKADWEAVKGFCKSIADAMAADGPDRFIATITKSKRRGMVLIDYLRNGRGATAVAAYSTRARPGAAVSMPLGWEEIGGVSGAAYFTVGNAVTRLAASDLEAAQIAGDLRFMLAGARRLTALSGAFHPPRCSCATHP